jgi:hypothetical protein
MLDLLDTTPSKPAATPEKKKSAEKNERPGRVASARTIRLREKILEAVRRRKNGVSNVELAELIKVKPGECLKLAQLLIKQKLILVKREKGSKHVTLIKP